MLKIFGWFRCYKNKATCETVFPSTDQIENYRVPWILAELTFSEEATFHISVKVNRHNCRIWGREKPQEVWQHQRDPPKLNVWCALKKSCIIGASFLTKQSVLNVTVPCYRFLRPYNKPVKSFKQNLLLVRRCTLPLCFKCATVI
jgi:hypothetical protein